MTAKTRGTRTRQRADRAEERALLELVSHGLSEEQPTTLLESRGALGTLTLDLDIGSSLRRTSPTLHRMLSTRWPGEVLLALST